MQGTAKERLVEVELPERPDYDEDANDSIDHYLEQAIVSAELAGNDYLCAVLKAELGSHRLDHK